MQTARRNDEIGLAQVAVDPALEERRLALEAGQQVRAATDNARFSWEYVRYRLAHKVC
jgi:hypothetical protein